MKNFLSKIVGFLLTVLIGPQIVRARTCDVAFTFRMGAGFAGDINRTHPFDCVPERQDATNPIARFGNPCLVNTSANTVRGIIAADASDSTAVNIYGVLVRPFPTQQNSTSQALGTATPPTAPAILDVLTEGLIMANVVGSPTKKGAVYVWAAAASGSHVLGGFESAASAGNTVRVANAYFNGPPDSNGVTEIRVWNQGA